MIVRCFSFVVCLLVVCRLLLVVRYSLFGVCCWLLVITLFVVCCL